MRVGLLLRGAALAGVVVAVAGGLAGCGDDDQAATAEPFVALDGSPRAPDRAGRLDAVEDDFSTLTLDGDTYRIDPALQSFAAVDASTQPLVRWVGQYVQVGLDGDVVQWISGISALVEVPGEPPIALLTDVLVEVDGEELVFRSGTVLRAAPGVSPPSAPPVAVVATIDVESDRVVELVPG